MSKAIDIHLSHLRFPSTCVVCRLPASKTYDLQKNCSYARGSYTVKINVPMCAAHFRAASFNRSIEKLAGILGVVAGILATTFVAILMLTPRTGIEQGSSFVFVAADAVGLILVLLIWTILSLSLMRFLAGPAFGEAYRAVRFKRYWPEDQFVRLEFQDEQLADLVLNTYPAPPRKRTLKVKLKPGTPRF